MVMMGDGSRRRSPFLRNAYYVSLEGAAAWFLSLCCRIYQISAPAVLRCFIPDFFLRESRRGIQAPESKNSMRVKEQRHRAALHSFVSSFRSSSVEFVGPRRRASAFGAFHRHRAAQK